MTEAIASFSVGTLLIIGYGFSARTYRARLGARADAVIATARSPEQAAALERAGIQPLRLDAADAGAIEAAFARADQVVVSAAPEATGDPILARHRGAVVRGLARGTGAWVGYLSTVGVYGDHGGGWVDETTACRPASDRSIWRLAAEQAWTAVGRETGARVAHLRLSGIYGPGRNAFVNLRDGVAKRLIKPGQVFNRILVDDIAAALEAAGAARFDGPLNVTDDEPAPPQDVVAEAARLMGVPVPPDQPYEPAMLSPMARSFYGENKRCANRILRERLKVTLAAPTYREGLALLWSSGTWAGGSLDQQQASPRFRARTSGGPSEGSGRG
jgi:nucleoside-diphosphate-sugar epimerase